MATSYRGRSGSRTRSNNKSFSYGFDNSSNWTKPGRKTSKTSVTGCASGYKGCCTTFENKINSFRTLCNQTKGKASFGRPSTATLNTFSNWINKGAVIQTCSATQVSRWARAKNKTFDNKTASPATCKNVLTAKFGKSTIKAVARTKSGSFMVVTSPTCKGKVFNFPF